MPKEDVLLPEEPGSNIKKLLKRFPAFRLARAASNNSDHHYKIGCVIAVHGRPVTVGYNHYKTHPKYTCKYTPTIHAEMQALLASNCSLNGGIAYIYREDSFGNPRLARPCNKCYQLLKDAGIKKIIYTVNEYPFYGRECL